MSQASKGRKNFLAHRLFQHKLFGPHPKKPILGSQKKVHVPHFLGKERKKGTHLNFFGGIFGVKTGVPNGPFSATKSLVYCFSLVPRVCSQFAATVGHVDMGSFSRPLSGELYLLRSDKGSHLLPLNFQEPGVSEDME